MDKFLIYCNFPNNPSPESLCFLNSPLCERSWQLPGRTDNEIKNYWNTRVKRRQRAGLPLYPQDIQKQATAFHLNQYHQPRPSPSPPPPGHLSTSQQPNPNFGSSLSLLDSLNFPATTHLPGHHNSPFLPSSFHRAKRFRDNSVGFSLPFSPTSPTQTTRPSSLFSQSFNTQLPPPTSFQFSSCNFDLNPQQIMRTPFEPDGKIPSASAFSMKLELPSSQQPQPATTAAALGTSNEFKITAPVARSNSGLLDALLQEAQDKVGSVNFSREELVEEKCGFDPPSGSVFRESAATPPLASGGKWDDSSSAHSSAGELIYFFQLDRSIISLSIFCLLFFPFSFLVSDHCWVFFILSVLVNGSSVHLTCRKRLIGPVFLLYFNPLNF